MSNINEVSPCPECGQIDEGQYGEYPCPTCGLPTLWNGDDTPTHDVDTAEPADVKAQIIICQTQKLSYMASHLDAKKRMENGQKQVFCETCQRWKWRDRLCKFAKLAAPASVLALFLLCAVVVLASTPTKEIAVNPGSLTGHACDATEWHFIITQVGGNKPPSIFDQRVNGYTETVPLAWETKTTAHYTSTAQLDAKVLTATAQIYESWTGTFNLSHGPCLPTAVMLSCDVRWDGPDVIVSWQNASFGIAEIYRGGAWITSIVEDSGEYVDRPGPGTFTYFIQDGMFWCGPITITVPHVAYLPLASTGNRVPRVLDHQGHEQTWDWLTAQFGDVRYERHGGPRLVQVQESPPDSPAVLDVYMVDGGGDPVQGVPVVRSWPGAPLLPEAYRGCGLSHGVWGLSKENGAVEFGLGHGDFYWPPAGGLSTVWVAEPDSDCLHGLGMLAGTNHVHVRSWFEVGP